MKRINIYTIILILLSLSFLSCGRNQMVEDNTLYKSLNNVEQSEIDKVSTRKIYFGHQSVGNNIISGLQKLINNNSKVQLNIVETDRPSDFSEPIFAHSKVGRNMDPLSKINDFSKKIESGIGGKSDIAFFKFCYIDINSETDVQHIFNEYQSSLAQLQQSYPQTKFIHSTAPLKTVTGLKASIKRLVKKIMGKSENIYEDNNNRNKFNDLIRKEYANKNQLFDLAALESTFTDGRRSIYQSDGQSFEMLVPEYTDDGGHLNEKGQQVIAEQFLIFLTSL